MSRRVEVPKTVETEIVFESADGAQYRLRHEVLETRFGSKGALWSPSDFIPSGCYVNGWTADRLRAAADAIDFANGVLR